MSTHNKEKKLLDQVRKIMRLRHYSIHTERAYCDWIKRYVSHHKMTCRDDLKSGEAKIEAFLTHLAVDKDISPSTQNQAMNALVFLYKQVLKQPLNDEINAVHAAKEVKLPVVMAREEVARVIALMEATTQLVVKLLYGSGLRITEAIRLRVKDIDYDVKQINVRSGKGAKDRVTTLSSSVNPQLENHLTRAKLIHENDLKDGYGEVYMPYALSRKYANAAKEWSWGIPGTPYLFPGPGYSGDTIPISRSSVLSKEICMVSPQFVMFPQFVTYIVRGLLYSLGFSGTFLCRHGRLLDSYREFHRIETGT